MLYQLLPGTRALIFDLDGTLADTMPFHMKAWQTTCREHGFEIKSDLLRSLTGTPAKKMAEAIIDQYDLRKTVSPDQLFQRKIEIFLQMQHEVKEVKPVADIVRKYYGTLPMAIGSGGFREAVFRTLEVIGMTGMFNVIVTSNDVANHKPHPETFLRCAEQMDTDPGSISVFEDGDLGIEAAYRAGMNAIDVRGWYADNW
ncbi:MAG TPA: HAD-IA family hydrolase [Bacteroidales bacterium]|nr:HAD-IA family hydrolase [Bacteroidales bacterium]